MRVLFGPKPRAAAFCACASLVFPPSSPSSPLPRQLSAACSEVGGRGREGGGGRNLGNYLIRSQQPGPALYSSVVFDSKREKRKNSCGGRRGGVHFSWRKTKENIFRVCERRDGSAELLQCVENAFVLAVLTRAHVATVLVGIFLLLSSKSQAQLNCRL